MASKPTLPVSKPILVVVLVVLLGAIYFVTKGSGDEQQTQVQNQDHSSQAPIVKGSNRELTYEEKIWQADDLFRNPVPVEKAYDYAVAKKQRFLDKCLQEVADKEAQRIYPDSDLQAERSNCQSLHNPNKIDRLEEEFKARSRIDARDCNDLKKADPNVDWDICTFERSYTSKEWQAYAAAYPEKAAFDYYVAKETLADLKGN